MKREHPFEKLMSGKNHHERLAALSSVAFEEGKVSYLLSAFKMNARKVTTELRTHAERTVGQPQLLLSSFNEMFPSFPLLLAASRLGGIKLHVEESAMLPSLFKAFGDTPFVAAYEEIYETLEAGANGRAVGLIFPRKGLRNGLILYTADDPMCISLCEREAYFVYAGGSKKKRHWLILRSFQKVVEAIYNSGHGWRPDQ